MPLAYQEQQPLIIPDSAYNTDDIATILITGGRYGGQWQLNAIPMTPGGPGEPAGSILTAADNRPGMAVDTALVWVNDAVARAGLKLAHFESKNDQYPPDQAPYFAAALALIDRRKEASRG
jgi:hypothetical protein